MDSNQQPEEFLGHLMRATKRSEREGGLRLLYIPYVQYAATWYHHYNIIQAHKAMRILVTHS